MEYSSDKNNMISKLTVNGCQIQLVTSYGEVVEKITALMEAKHDLYDLVISEQLQPILNPSLDSNHSNDMPKRFIGVSEAYAGILDTGSLVLLSSEKQRTAINFLSEIHIIILSSQRLIRDKNALWELMKSEKVEMPRAVNIISGPSRTADIEQTIQIGAHGPCELIVTLFEQ